MIKCDFFSFKECRQGKEKPPVWANKPASAINTLLNRYDIGNEVSAVFTFSGGGDNDKCMNELSRYPVNIRTDVALADRSNANAEKNEEKLRKFVEKIRSLV